MTQAEFKIWTALFHELYPGSMQMKTKESMTIWFNCFRDMTFDEAKAALSATFMTDKFEPKTPAVIRENAVKLTDDSPAWSEAWAKVQMNVRKYGACIYDADRLEECMASFDEATRRAVQQMGWKDICLSDSENKNVLRAQFRGIYETVQKRQQYERQLSPMLTGKGREALNG